MARRQKSKFASSRPRTLDDSDFDAFYKAADGRSAPLTREQIIAKLERKNSYHMWALRYHYRWVRRQMKKMGLNPDDARELL